MAVTTDGLVAEYVAKLAEGGTSPGHNDGSPTTTWTNLIAASHGTLYTGSGGFAWTTSSGWAGAGTAGDPYCLVSDGTSDTVSIPASAAVNPTGDFSFEMWLLTSNTASAQVYGTNYTNYQGSQLGNDITTGRAYGRFALAASSVYTGGGADSILTNGAWRHVVWTYSDGGGGAYTQYVDHAAVAGTQTGDYVPRTGTAFSLLNTLIGKLATFRCYNKALSHAEIDANYAAGVTAASTDGAAVFTGMTVTRLLQG